MQLSYEMDTSEKEVETSNIIEIENGLFLRMMRQSNWKPSE